MHRHPHPHAGHLGHLTQVVQTNFFGCLDLVIRGARVTIKPLIHGRDHPQYVDAQPYGTLEPEPRGARDQLPVIMRRSPLRYITVGNVELGVQTATISDGIYDRDDAPHGGERQLCGSSLRSRVSASLAPVPLHRALPKVGNHPHSRAGMPVVCNCQPSCRRQPTLNAGRKLPRELPQMIN